MERDSFSRKAADKKAGMTLAALNAALEVVKVQDGEWEVRVESGFRGQIKKVTFNRVDDEQGRYV